mgnify:CR=1 FL=1|tara:strand:+ start:56 stop:181 length:126 start_codon:yes stop_codon:yes gene_type:complete
MKKKIIFIVSYGGSIIFGIFKNKKLHINPKLKSIYLSNENC